MVNTNPENVFPVQATAVSAIIVPAWEQWYEAAVAFPDIIWNVTLVEHIPTVARLVEY